MFSTRSSLILSSQGMPFEGHGQSPWWEKCAANYVTSWWLNLQYMNNRYFATRGQTPYYRSLVSPQISQSKILSTPQSMLPSHIPSVNPSPHCWWFLRPTGLTADGVLRKLGSVKERPRGDNDNYSAISELRTHKSRNPMSYSSSHVQMLCIVTCWILQRYQLHNYHCFLSPMDELAVTIHSQFTSTPC